MERSYVSRLEELSLELACTNDTLKVFELFAAERIDNNKVGEALYGIWSHYTRISESLDKVLNDMGR